MTIVFDNIVYNLQRAGGISRFWSKITAPYLRSEQVVFVERSGAESNIYRQAMPDYPRGADHPLPLIVARYLNFRRNFFARPFVFHSSYFRVNTAPGCVNVTTVHDLIYEKFGSGPGTVLHLRQKAAALKTSDCIVCVSEHTRKDLLEHYPFCRQKRVEVIPNGVDGFAPTGFDGALMSRAGIERADSYFLYVGHRGECKGFDLVHDAIDLLDGSLRCVVVGAPFTPGELARIESRGHANAIVNIGKVSDAELNSLYSSANFFFFPSLYEGFGIPPLEAMSAGCPVLASNQSSVPEVIGDAGILFDPRDKATLKAGLECITDAATRARLRELGHQRACSYSWSSVIAQYRDLYASLLGNVAVGAANTQASR